VGRGHTESRMYPAKGYLYITARNLIVGSCSCCCLGCDLRVPWYVQCLAHFSLMNLQGLIHLNLFVIVLERRRTWFK
jgi:hypothetical protein